MDNSEQHYLSNPQTTTADVLRRARALIDTPKKWRQFAGNCVMPSGKDGHCMMSAVWAATQKDDWRDHTFQAARLVLQDVTGEDTVHEWNDSPNTTHADVMQAFDRAIALAESL